MGKIQEAVADVLAAELAGRTEWDEMPVLYRLHLRDRVPSLVPVDLGVWAAGLDMRPPDALAMIADMMVAGNFRPKPDDPAGALHGMAFRHEGWWATQPGGFVVNSPEGRLAMHQGREHLVHTRPDRIEIRIVVAVDRAGITYQVIQPRDQAEPERLIMYPNRGKDQPQATGLVVESLDLMVAQLCGVPSPTRPQPPGPEWN